MRALLALLVALLIVATVGMIAPAFAAPPTTGAVLTAATQTVYVDTNGLGGVGISLQGTWSATVQFEATVDGINWVAINATPPNSVTAVTSSTATGVWQASAAGMAAVRCRVSAFTSGSIQVTFQTAQSKP